MSARRVCVIDIPGLSRDLLAHVPKESALGKFLATQSVASLRPTFPAVTCSVQATLTTGKRPAQHGILANGIATFRHPADQALIDADGMASFRRNVSFWEQSNQFLDVPRFWQDETGKSKWRTALVCMQHSMPGFAGTLRPAADIVLTPKPDHRPDGSMSLCWSEPADLVATLFGQFGPFPLMNYWGPMAGLASSAWIAKASASIWKNLSPELQWSYIPHLDYDLQRFGPDSPQALAAVRDMAGAVEPLIETVLSDADASRLIVLSEYAICPVNACIAPNRVFAEAGLLKTRATPDGPIVDYETSDAFAMVDHQIAHVYCRNAQAIGRAEKALAGAGIGFIPGAPGLDFPGARHRRAGDLILRAPENAWFDYRWWNNPADMPPFATQIDIHRKPGYDPLELFWDKPPKSITQDAAKIRGSHGLEGDKSNGIIAANRLPPVSVITAEGVAALIQDILPSR